MTMDKAEKYAANDEVMNDPSKCNGTGSHDEVVMESGGVTDADCPNYVEEDDVRDSIAEGYF